MTVLLFVGGFFEKICSFDRRGSGGRARVLLFGLSGSFKNDRRWRFVVKRGKVSDRDWFFWCDNEF